MSTCTDHKLFTHAQQTEFERSGYVRLGKILSDGQLQTMRDRLDGMLKLRPPAADPSRALIPFLFTAVAAR